LLLAMTHVISMISKVPWGLLAERVPVRYCLMVVVLGRAGGLLSLLLFTSPLRVFGYVFIAGSMSYVMGPLQAQIWADYFGRAFIGSIRGILAPFSLLSSIAGPLFAAFIFDHLGSYNAAFWVFVVTLSLSAIVLFFAKPPTGLPQGWPGDQPAPVPAVVP
jgi:MFS family permease